MEVLHIVLFNRILEPTDLTIPLTLTTDNHGKAAYSQRNDARPRQMQCSDFTAHSQSALAPNRLVPVLLIAPN